MSEEVRQDQSRGQRSALRKRLRGLSQGAGVCQPDLHERLGPELRQLWAIESDDATTVREMVTARLEELISGLKNLKELDRVKSSARLSFNLPAASSRETSVLKQRHQMHSRKSGFSVETIRRDFDHALDALEGEIHKRLHEAGIDYGTLQNPEAQASSGTATSEAGDASESAAEEKGETQASSHEDKPRSVHNTNYGLFNFVSQGPTFINRISRKNKVSALSAIFLLLVAGGVWVWSADTDQASKGSSSGGKVSNSKPDSATSPSPDISAKEAEAPSVPLTATVTHYIPSTGAANCFGWVFPGKSMEQIPVPGDGLSAAWAHELGGTDSVQSNIKVSIQGLTDTDVALNNIRVVDLRKEPALRGPQVWLGAGCGSFVPGRNFRVLLANPNPAVESVTIHDDGTSTVANQSFNFKVTENDLEVFEIEALPHSSQENSSPLESCGCLVTWKLALDWSHKGETGTLIIDDHGKPFQTNDGAADDPIYIKQEDAWQLMNPGAS
ncbi:hypothetical protein [Streptomyces sp. NPDC002845]